MKITFAGKNGDPLEELSKEIKEFDKFLKLEVDTLAHETAFKMKAIINEGKVRPQAGDPTNLENAIEPELFDGGWGVGAIETLKKDAPWWAAFNWGSSHMVGKRLPPGSFVPDPGTGEPKSSNFRTGRWKTPGDFSAIVKKPILATNYIEKTIFWLSAKIDELKG